MEIKVKVNDPTKMIVSTGVVLKGEKGEKGDTGPQGPQGETPSDDHIIELIEAKLSEVENGSY